MRRAKPSSTKRDALLNRPRWAPPWMPSVDDERSVRWLRWLLVVLLGVGLVAFVARAANGPANPELERLTEIAPRGFGSVAVEVTSPGGDIRELCVMVATTPAQRQRGLMEVTDPALGGYAGMLFAFPADTTGGFWMRNTPQPLTVAYFDAEGRFVSSADMEPCRDSPRCPSYPPEGTYRWALEVLKGKGAELGVEAGSTLRPLNRACQPSA